MKANGDNRVCILGMGYVGLTLAAVMADRGFKVFGAEINPKTLATIQEGRAHFFEVNMDLMLRRGLKAGNLEFGANVPADRSFDVYVITVGTPLDDSGNPRMDMVENVASDIAANMQDGALVVLRSTVSVGTTMKVVKPILDATGHSFDLAFCPERTIEGKALEELRSLPQVVGGLTPEANERAMKVFRRLTPTIVEVSSIETAELIKLLDNSFRDVFFSFGNEVALLSEALGLKAHEVIRAANTGYIRTNIARPGFVGGPCLEKDPHILAHSLKQVDHVARLIGTGRALNESLVEHGLRSALELLGERRPDRELTISVMGLAFKGRPDTDDLRGSPSLLMLDAIRRELPSARILGQDYVATDAAIAELDIEPVDDTRAFEGADIVMVMNNNFRYERLDVEARAGAMNRPGVICDFWNLFADRTDLPEGLKLYVLGA